MRDVATRAAWTFVQAFLSVLLVSSPLDLSVPALKAAALAGLAAALSVVKTVAVQQVQARRAP